MPDARPSVPAPLTLSAGCSPSTVPDGPARLLVDIKELSRLLSRSVPSLHRDDAAGRLPAAVRLGGSKRWRYDEIVRWLAAGCPDRKTWEALDKTLTKT